MGGFRILSPRSNASDKKVGEVFIPMIAFIERGMMLPMGRISINYLINHRLTPHQCAPNLFRVLGCISALNEQMNLGLMWYDMFTCMSATSLAARDTTSSLGLTLLN